MAVAREFYGDKLGLKEVNENDGGVTFASGDTKLFVYEAPSGGTNQASSATWSIDDLAGVVEELKAAGVTFEHYEGMPIEWEGDIAVMGPTKAAWFKDPSGNTLALVQM
jgi:catechol 2,3-dioxygenase-like lactoylglutathione lyase family enzyme